MARDTVGLLSCMDAGRVAIFGEFISLGSLRETRWIYELNMRALT